jgi:hypothetical protein
MAQVSVAPSPVAKQQFFGVNGAPLASGCIFTYISTTSTPQATYTDYTGTALNPNPIILDSGGFANIWLSNVTYRFVLVSAGGVNCASGVSQYTVDGVSAYSIINSPQNLFLLGATSDPGGTAGELAYRSDIPCFRGFTTFWDCFVRLTDTQTLTNKTLSNPAFTGAATGLVATSPTLNSPTINGLTLGGVSVASGNPTNFTNFTNGAAGTALNLLSKLAPVGSGTTAVSTAITDTGGVEGVVVGGAGTSGIVVIQRTGQVLCVFDGSTTVNDYVQISSTTVGNCHDTGATTYPLAGGQVLGRVLSTNVGAGTYLLDLFGPEVRAGGLTVAVNTTGLGANVSSTPLITPTANGMYRFTCYVVLTQAATNTSSTPSCNALYTDADTNVSETIQFTTGTSANTLGAIVGPVPSAGFFAKSGVAISYSTAGYATNGATSMTYALHIRLEGPY